MFEKQLKKAVRKQIQTKNTSTSRSKLVKKQLNIAKQKIILQVIKTEDNLKDKKSKSQCLSRQNSKGQKKSIDVSKFINTARSSLTKKSREKTEIIKTYEPLHTENRHQNYIISNLTTEKSTELKWRKKNSLKKGSSGRSAEHKKSIWNESNLPYDWQYVLQNYQHYLTKYEQSQIKQYKKIYYIGHKAAKRQNIDSFNPVFDTEEKEYKFVENDHIAYRYQLLSVIGKGSYGQVFKVYDHKTKQQIALKMIKNDPKFSKQAFIEIKILSHIKEVDSQQQANIVKIKDFVIFRKHVCLLFELLSDNLYELVIRNNYNGLSQELIRRFAIQILVGLQFLKSQNIIHCDLKPQNILLKEYNKSGIKIIDFGSSCFDNETIYTYIQSRYYRAPEITLGINYDQNIDIWSTGCILAELYTGVPVFPGENQYEQIKYMTDTLGIPPLDLLNKGVRKKVFFQDNGKIKAEIKSINTTIDMFSKPLKERIQNQDFLSFIQMFLKWAPEQRISPLKALSHRWISKGLPEQLKSKLITNNTKLFKREISTRKESTRQIKSKSKQKISTPKIVTKLSQQKLKKYYGIKH